MDCLVTQGAAEDPMILPVGIKNGYDEVNIQISAKYEFVFPQQIMLGQKNIATYVPEIKLRSNSNISHRKHTQTSYG